jgi:hypothetical protein
VTLGGGSSHTVTPQEADGQGSPGDGIMASGPEYIRAARRSDVSGAQCGGTAVRRCGSAAKGW